MQVLRETEALRDVSGASEGAVEVDKDLEIGNVFGSWVTANGWIGDEGVGVKVDCQTEGLSVLGWSSVTRAGRQGHGRGWRGS